MPRRSRAFLVVTAIGVVFLLLAVFSHALGLTGAGIGMERVLCAAFGVFLTAIGLLRRRFFHVYQTAVVLIANTIVLLAILEFGATIYRRLDVSMDAPNSEASDAMTEARRSGVVRSLYVGWLGQPTRGEYVSIRDDGLRETPNDSSDDDRKPIRIFAFGGSTMWGAGAADGETIPAYLQTLIREQTEHPVEVINYGQRAWISTQNLIQLMLELRNGNIPDVVVFYDGYNDTFAACAVAKAGVPENFGGIEGQESAGLGAIVRLARKSSLGHLLIPHAQYPQSDSSALASEVIQMYTNIYRMVVALGQEYGFETQFYWQPQLATGNKPLTEIERSIQQNHPWLPPIVIATTRETYSRVHEIAGQLDRMTDISDAFDGITDQLFIDPCHVQALGNRRVAEVMLERGLLQSVRECIDARSRASIPAE